MTQFTTPSVHQPDFLLPRIGLLAVGGWLWQVGFRIFPAASVRVGLVPVLFAVYLLGFVAIAIALGPERWLRRAQVGILLAALFGVIAAFAVEVTAYDRGYATDTLAFSHLAAEQVLAGRNPYLLRSGLLAGEFPRLGFPPQFVNATTAGQPFDGLAAYPALHFLVFVPAVAAGLKDLRWVVLACLAASLWLLFHFSHRRVQPIVLLPLLVNPDIILRFPAGSGTDWIWALPLMAAALLLHRGRISAAGVAFGIACAVKQQPWVAAPFLAVWLLRSGGRGTSRPTVRIGSFFGAGALAFLLPNLPFMVWDFPSWRRGVLAPLVSALISDGQGLSLLSTMGLFPLPREAYGALLLLMTLAGVSAYWTFFPALHRLLWLFPAALMWTAYRSLHNYLIYWLPLTLLWMALPERPAEATGQAADVRPFAVRRPPPRLRRVVVSVAVIAALAGGLSALARGSAQGIEWGVPRLQDRYRLGAVDAISVEVTNRFPTVFEPVFTVMQSGFPITWDIEVGPDRLRPNQAALHRLAAPVAEALLLPRVGLPRTPTGEPAPSYLRLDGRGSDSGRSGDLLEIAPAFLRVNHKGDSRIYSVWLSGHTVRRPPTLNPEFRYWRVQDRATLRSAPIGWRPETRPRDSRTGEAREQSFAGRRAAALTLNPGGTGGLEHIGLTQDVTSPACVFLSVYLTHRFLSRDGLPVEAQGIELARGGRLVWYLFSDDVDAPRAVSLSPGSRLVILPGKRQAWLDVELDVRSEVERIGGAGRTVSLKAFVALNDPLADRSLGPRTMFLSRLEASPQSCPGRS